MGGHILLDSPSFVERGLVVLIKGTDPISLRKKVVENILAEIIKTFCNNKTIFYNNMKKMVWDLSQ